VDWPVATAELAEIKSKHRSTGENNLGFIIVLPWQVQPKHL
jgi:hypothetical protein